MAFAGPGSGSTDDDGGDAFVPPRVLDDALGIQPRRRRQPTSDAVLLQRSQTCFYLSPIRAGRIGQHFEFRLHATAQRSAHFQQALHRRDRAQGDDDAAFHDSSADRTQPAA